MNNQDLPDKPDERIIAKPEPPAAGVTNGNDVLTETVSKQIQLKFSRSGKFEVLCDEPAHLGGKGEHPQPLTYLAMSVGF